jgi:hypothetical protein
VAKPTLREGLGGAPEGLGGAPEGLGGAADGVGRTEMMNEEGRLLSY